MAVQGGGSPSPDPAAPAGAVAAMHLLDCAQSRGGIDRSFGPLAQRQSHAGGIGEGEREGAYRR